MIGTCCFVQDQDSINKDFSAANALCVCLLLVREVTVGLEYVFPSGAEMTECDTTLDG